MGREDQGVAKSQDRYRVIPRSLCFIINGEDVLLLRGGPQKRLWAGLYNGVGGHIEAGEDIYSAVLREIKEETGLSVHDVRLRLVVHADAGDPGVGIMIFVFTASSNSREVVESAEGTLEWVPCSHLPLANVVEDLPLLLPRLLAMAPDDPTFFAAYTYDDADHLRVNFVTAQ